MKKFICSFFIIFSLLTTFPTSALDQTTNQTKADIDLIWQGETYTPPFYKGRALWSKQGRLRLLAIPQIPGVDPNTLLYKWSKNNTVLGTANGVGKNSLAFGDSILSKPVNIKVDVMGEDGALLATKSVTLAPTNTSLLIYEFNPLLGYLFSQEIGSTYKLQKPEVSLAAFPLYFSVPRRNFYLLEYEWGAGSTVQKSDVVTYRLPPNHEKGEAKISLKVSNKDRIMQNGTRTFVIQFNQ